MVAPNKKRFPIIFIILGTTFALCMVCVVAGVAMNASGNSLTSPTANSADKYIQEYGGNPDVYTRIFQLTDCAELQKEFDQAEANLSNQQPGTDQYKWGIGYMAASDDRMIALGCYK